jgi:sulfatase maturation enzyme AslB (radical SAM superfamily)
MYGQERAEALVREEKRPTIRHLEISFSNVCNLTCAMCSSEFSSSWIAPDKSAIEKGLGFRDFTGPFHRVARVSPELLEEVFEHVDDLDLIIIKGGEPTREPICLNFLQELVKRRSRPGPFVFLQSNGTRHPSEWLKGLDSLQLEIGISLDGWGEVNDWIRGSRFEQVISHMEYLDEVPFVRNLTVDFTLSAYNVFHLPEFFAGMVSLRDRLKKELTCPVFQWVQQPYSSPLALRDKDRLEIERQCRPILEANQNLFLNFENLLEVLRQPRAPEAQVKKCADWLRFMQEMRKKPLPYQERLTESLA